MQRMGSIPRLNDINDTFDSTFIGEGCRSRMRCFSSQYFREVRVFAKVSSKSADEGCEVESPRPED